MEAIYLELFGSTPVVGVILFVGWRIDKRVSVIETHLWPKPKGKGLK